MTQGLFHACSCQLSKLGGFGYARPKFFPNFGKATKCRRRDLRSGACACVKSRQPPIAPADPRWTFSCVSFNAAGFAYWGNAADDVAGKPAGRSAHIVFSGVRNPSQPSLGTLIKVGYGYLVSGEWTAGVVSSALVIILPRSADGVQNWRRARLDQKLR
ncbi:hypothetical protein V1T76_21625 [Roseibium sp. FZY0029]|uniref:hypothetical protein n=1 Tax=Roseibium sp. FZY0029 TaxID=3116647 RepID=UPI002EAF0494|nr:hypothetical protein [Roseibium sp. FZY0029]